MLTGTARNLWRCATLVLTVWLSMNRVLPASTLDAGNAAGVPGSQILLPIQFTSDLPATALQVDVLYDGALLQADGTAPGPAATGHLANSDTPDPGHHRFVLYSLQNAPLAKGAVANVGFTIFPLAPLGALTVTLTNAVLAAFDGVAIAPATLSAGTITVTLAAPAQWTVVTREANGTVHLTADATPDQPYEIQASTDLSTWTPIATQVATNGVLEVFDTGATALPHRFYRTRSGP